MLSLEIYARTRQTTLRSLSERRQRSRYAVRHADLEPLTKRGQASEADDGTAQGQEGFMDVSTALVADPQPAELVQPAQGSLHHPAVHSQTAAVFRAPSSQGLRDVAPAQFLAVPPRVIGPVGVQPLRPAAGSGPVDRAPAAPCPPGAATGLRRGDWPRSGWPTEVCRWPQ